MRSTLLRLLAFAVPLLSPLAGNAQNKENADPVIEELLSMKLAALGELQVYTANRELTPIEEAPSVVSVITAEQISRQGLKSLHEVLARVPGFFNATSPFIEPISNRGFVQNTNGNYLLLVDGHSLNDSAAGSFHSLHLMPGLDRVARIEIIRGPGSTLWGSDAGMGIIHIITRDGAELDRGENPSGTFNASYDYEFDHQRNVLQTNYGKRFDDGGLLLSGNFFNSDPKWTTSYQAGATDFEIQNSRQMNVWDFEDSHDLYAKLNWKGWNLKAGDLKLQTYNPLFTYVDGSSTAWRISERQWIELGNEQPLTPNWLLQWRLYRDDFSKRHYWENQDSYYANQSIAINSKGLGGELLLHYRNDDHHFLLGASADNKELITETVDVISSGGEDVSEEWPAFTDRNRALFFEETYRGIDSWVITLGGRFDSNEPRDPDDKFLPRFAASHSLDDRWSVKYAYNTGYVRPSAVQRRGGIQAFGNEIPQRYRKGADESQKSRSHDLQLFYNRNRTRANVTLFHHTFSNLIQYAGFGPVSVGGFDNVTLLETNMGDMVTQGMELDAESELNDGLRLYGNYTYADAKYQDRYTYYQGQVILDIVTEASVATEDLTVTGTPKHIWNLGLDWDIRNDLVFNIHYRGWTNAWAKRTTEPSFQRYGPYHYFDLNLRQHDFLTKELTLSAYIKNIFDNDDPLPGGVNDGQVVPQNGRQLGIKMSYQF